MNRRDVITKAGAIALAGLSSAAMADDMAHDHHHMQGGLYQPLVDTTADCVAKGQACISHCFDLLGLGEKEMAACAKSVNQMLALCGALESLANQQSKHVAALAALTMDACQACETECRKHEMKHAVCKACADSCVNCVKQCKAFSA
ncbi:four-helix bundle copper-binding protein [Collimonas humicola]|uniref:four-helix bundle copper-binding protein n=1 Tax=Collimonas humicola TaxID=2825886 RepID=UPI001B8AABDE|nr:four-helix bundle copper-binding protein [Collimonas humicola]